MRYFAYCTLLDTNEMQKFCPGAQPTVVASLSGYRVVFGRYLADGDGGGCQLEAAPGHEIYGLIYELSADEFDQLDRISGVDRGYYKRVGFIASTPTGTGIDVFTYIIPNSAGPFHPTAAYVRPILAGARALELPADYVAELEATVQAAVLPENGAA